MYPVFLTSAASRHSTNFDVRSRQVKRAVQELIAYIL